MSYRPRLTLYYREGCHLCEDLERQLPELLKPDSYRLLKVDIDTDDALKHAYNIRVPVLKCEDHEVCEHFLDLEALHKALERALASYNRGLSGTDPTP
ncbi:MAG: glutaredoxin family protein [Granulosicoccus sp.]